MVTKCFRTLHKIHTFVETQQKGSKVKKFFHKGELNALLRDCKTGLEQGFNFFEIQKVNFMTDIVKMRQDAEQKHKESIHDKQNVFGILQKLQLNFNVAI
ncbi:hypothetical protein MVEN_00720300 [Mycena venus]|uniref:Uncharacterized protein n=1 Tax=Mycena venus TaxID=2733690 RepID=A0A8H6YJ37_9AGAR|nr:hypothetical protein MVEN_00720300 [Mycena venus]